MTSNPNDRIVFITSCEAYTNDTIAALDQLSDTVRARAEVVGTTSPTSATSTS